VNTAKRNFALGLLKMFYPALMVMCFGLATALLIARMPGSTRSLASFLSMRVKIGNLLVIASILLLWHLVFSIFGFYESKRMTSPIMLAFDAAKATTLSAIVLAFMGKLFEIKMLTPTFGLTFWLLSSAVILLARIGVRYVLREIRTRGHNLRHVLILGTNPRAIEFARKIESKPELGYRVLGFADDTWEGSKEFQESGYRLSCELSKLSEFLRHNVVDEVAIYLPLRSYYEQASKSAALCEQHGILVRFPSDIFNLKIARPLAVDLDGMAHITAHSGSSDTWALLAKRALDVMVSSILLVLLAPAIAVVALLIKLDSEGPVLFRQERIGLNKRRFRIFKFRTMVVNAEKLMVELEAMNEVTGPVFKIKNDPRRTRVGGFLRRTSIDELPQLLNVVMGDMSLVGPRPLPVRDYEGFSVDWQRRRFSIRPGITCLWQVHGRSEISFDKWMELDLQYMDEWSFWLDLKILARTVPAVLKGSGAA
jgi:exopolysaccharide biosynthesis polyprenyl glycosylphosphotransferase